MPPSTTSHGGIESSGRPFGRLLTPFRMTLYLFTQWTDCN